MSHAAAAPQPGDDSKPPKPTLRERLAERARAKAEAAPTHPHPKSLRERIAEHRKRRADKATKG